ncbi:MAG TPA: hypothetical protein VGJ45_15620 [Pseudonocardiaceae bacterium]|jgi:hypothetical protein
MTTPTTTTGAYLQIVAHMDDDLLFMNPDVQDTINAGLPITSLYLTCGEAFTTPDAQHPGGPNTVLPLQIGCRPQSAGQAWPPNFTLSRADYAGCRQEGSRAAWAQMAGVPNNWIRKSVTVTNGSWSRDVEVDTLSGTTGPVTLIFVNLPEWADNSPDTLVNPLDTPGASLAHIYQNGSTRNTIMVTESMLTQPQSYALSDLITLVQQLVAMYDITVLRLQDPKPDSRYEQGNNGLGWQGDHLDHIMTTDIATQAVAHIARLQVVNYRNYNTQDSEINLDTSQQTAKTTTFGLYATWDADIGNATGYPNWPLRQYHRFWTGDNWIGRNANGSLLVFSVQDGDLLMWTQTGLGTFTGPISLGAPGWLAPGLAVGNNADGRVEVFALRMDTWDTVTVYQTAVNGSPTQWAWANLSNPNAGGGDRTQVGQPCLAMNQDGRMQIFAKNGGGGISTTYQTAVNAGWTTNWTDLGNGPGVQDGLCALLNPAGLIELFAYTINANGKGSILNLYQPQPNVGFNTAPSFATFEPASPPTMARNADGRMDVFYRVADSTANGHHGADVGHTWQTAVASGYTTTPENIGGNGGVGPVSAVSAPHNITDARILLTQRNRNGGISICVQGAPNAGYGAWQDMGTFISTEPTLAADATGAMYLLAFDGNGKLLVARQTSAAGGAPFGAWAQQGS